MKFEPGEMLPATLMGAVAGRAITLPDQKRLVRLQFRRLGECPICNTYIAEFRKRGERSKLPASRKRMFHSSLVRRGA